MFQSLKGFRRLWIDREFVAGSGKCCVSIPKRVSETLNQDLIAHLRHDRLFQSLKGFRRLWILMAANVPANRLRFQSLKGFRRLWIPKAIILNVGSVSVSIPKRVSETLNPYQEKCFFLGTLVSIPKRVSETLNQKKLVDFRSLQGFQSLKGFRRLWILWECFTKC